MAASAPPPASITRDEPSISAVPARPGGSAQPGPASPPSWRSRIRQRPVLGPLWRGAVFLAGLLCIVAGVALTVLPGPLTIPPILLGLYLWSTEFSWARRLFAVFRTKGRRAWQHARRHPLGAGVVTVGGLLVAAIAMWSVGHFHLIARVGDLFGS
jgi:hypothetical protein